MTVGLGREDYHHLTNCCGKWLLIVPATLYHCQSRKLACIITSLRMTWWHHPRSGYLEYSLTILHNKRITTSTRMIVYAQTTTSHSPKWLANREKTSLSNGKMQSKWNRRTTNKTITPRTIGSFWINGRDTCDIYPLSQQLIVCSFENGQVFCQGLFPCSCS